MNQRRTGGIAQWFSSKDHRYSAVKLALLVLLAVFVWTTLSGNSARNVDFEQLAAHMAQQPYVDSMQRGDANAAKKTLGMDASEYEQWLFYTADSLMDVSEMLIVYTANDDARANAQDCVERRLAAQKDSFRDYGTNQYQLLEDAVVLSRGDYLFYCVSEHADAWSDAFVSYIR